MKQTRLSIFFTLATFFLMSNANIFGQYTETFSTANKGILSGACTTTLASCASTDFSGVNWTIEGDFSGMDNNDFLSTNGAGQLNFFGDIDPLLASDGLCFVSPELDISAVGGMVSLSVDIQWTSHDVSDYIDVEYNRDNSGWVQVPNQIGGGTHTIDYNSDVNTGATIINQNVPFSAAQALLKIRVCVQTNSSGDNTLLNSVSVPEIGAIVLPVELIDLTAKKMEKAITLEWSTASEINNEKFVVEHSIDGKNFKEIGETVGQGTSIEINHYAFQHEIPVIGLNYYRLKQIDFDGRFEHSKTIAIQLETGDEQIGALYPNPSKTGFVYLDYVASKNSMLEVTVLDGNGQVISLQESLLDKSLQTLEFDFSDLSSGLYFIKIDNGVVPIWKKLVIK